MENLIKCKNYAFCLNKLKKKKVKLVKNPIGDIGKTKPNDSKNFYDSIINKDKRIKSTTKIINKIKKEAIKECVYTNVKIPIKWKLKIGFNNFVNKLISNDDNFLYYLSLNPKNENNKNKNKRIRPKIVLFSSNDKNNLFKIPFFGINKSKNKTKQSLNTNKEVLSSRNLINSNKYSTYDLFKNSGLKFAKNILYSSSKTDRRLIKPGKSTEKINFFKKIENNLFKRNSENIKEKDTTPVNYSDIDRLKNLSTVKFKKRLLNFRNCLYSNFQSSEQSNSTGRSTHMIKNNSCKYLIFKK